MVAGLGTTLAGACPSCGRRYVPGRAACAFCRIALELAAPARRARVLARTRVHRTPLGSLLDAPYDVAWLQELDEGTGGVFLAPVDGGGRPVDIGATVALEVRTWDAGGGAPFAGVIAVPEPA